MPWEMIPTKEFSSDFPGLRVGWSAVTEPKVTDPDQPTCVDIVAGNIGRDGARVGYVEYIDNNGDVRQIREPKAVDGFVAVTGLSVIIRNNKIVPSDGVVNFRFAEDANFNTTGYNAQMIVNNGVSGVQDYFPEDEQKKWGSNPAELIDNLKSDLSEHQAIHHYPDIYHLLNGFLGHIDHRNHRHRIPDEMILADPEMHDQTLGRLEIFKEAVQKYGDAIELDEDMKRNLTVFSHVPAGDITDVFTESRRRAHEIEASLFGSIGQLPVSGLVYLPTGFRPSGRTWPYMDAAVKNEDHAFGQELAALKNETPESVVSELEKELRELRRRSDYAIRGTSALRHLSNAEEVLLTSQIL